MNDKLIPANAVNNNDVNNPTTTSLMVAEVFGKNHKNVLQAISQLEIPEEWNRLNFQPVEYKDKKGELRPMIEMTRDGFDILVMGFNGKEAMKYKLAFLEAFNRMKQQVATLSLPQNYKQALVALVEEVGRREELEQARQIDAPKVAFAESISVSDDTILIRDMAKLITNGRTCRRIGGNGLFQWMRDNGYVIRANGSDYNMPTQRSINLGVLVIKEGSRNNGANAHITKTTKVTGKGQLYFMSKFKTNKEAVLV